MKHAIKKRKSTVFVYWIIPIVALIIAFMMLKEKYEVKGKRITIILNNVNGINVKRNFIVYNGIKIGTIDNIKIDENNLNHFKVYATIYKKYDYLVKKGTKFWKVSPEISFSKGVKNLDTIIKGSYIEILPPKLSKKELEKLPDQYNFVALNIPPLNGVITFIKTKNSSFSTGTPIIYNGIQVGEIIGKELKNGYLFYKILIYKKYKDVLAQDTKFIPLNAIEFQASFEKIKLKIPSIKRLITGAIQIQTQKKGTPPKKIYSLYIPKKILKGKKFIIVSNEKLPSLLFYKGFNVGKLLKSELIGNKIYNQFVIYEKYKNLINNSTLFFKLNAVEMKASLSNFYFQFSNLKSAILGGVTFITLSKRAPFTKNKFKIFKNRDEVNEYLYKRSGGKIVTLLTDKLEFIKKGTEITYNSLPAGKVLNFRYNPKFDKIEIRAIIKRPFTKLINKTTKFYKNGGIKFKANLNGIKVETPTLNSIVNGTISFIAEKRSPDNTKIFTLLNYDDLEKENFFKINLTMEKTNGVKVGSKLKYRGFTLGEVENLIFDKNIIAIIKIPKKYKYLFGKNSKLYLEKFQVGLNGIKNSDAVIFGTDIILIADKNDGFKQNFKVDAINPISSHYKKGLRIVLQADSKMGLNVNSPLYYRKVKIGHIEKIELSKTAQHVNFFVFISQKYRNIIRTNSKFFNTGVLAVKANLFGVKIKTGTLESMIKGGIEVVTPDNPGQKVENGAIFKLYNEPQEEWFKYHPKLLLKK